jgi:adenylylsulfate kinase-like enzyme
MNHKIYWFYGRSGAGKTTLSETLAERLQQRGFPVFKVDGDKLRSGLCYDLNFDAASRTENHRRAAEVALLAMEQGFIVLGATMCPQHSHRSLLREILGENLRFIYLDADHEACSQRDPKGLYRRFDAGQLEHFHRDTFQEPTVSEFDKRIHTGARTIEECADEIEDYIK